MSQNSYMPAFLTSTKAICKAFRVGTPRVHQWVQQGAPIAVDRDARGIPVRYYAEAMRLYLWLEARGKPDGQ